MKQTFGKLGHRQENSFKIGMREIGWCGMDWMYFTYNRDSWIDFCEHSIEPTGFIICGKFLELAEELVVYQEGLCCMEQMGSLSVISVNSSWCLASRGPFNTTVKASVLTVFCFTRLVITFCPEQNLGQILKYVNLA